MVDEFQPLEIRIYPGVIQDIVEPIVIISLPTRSLAAAPMNLNRPIIHVQLLRQTARG